jgi:hypothetical protein
VNPHCTQSAPVLRKPSFKAIMELPCATIEEIQDRAYMCVILFTGMRTRDVHSVKSKNVIFVACTVETCPRHIDFRLDTSKMINIIV